MMMTFNGFAHKYNLKSKAASNRKIQQVLSSLSVNDAGIFLRDGLFSSDIATVNLHPSKGTRLVSYINENCFFF